MVEDIVASPVVYPQSAPLDLYQELFFRGELECAKLRLERPVTLVVSTHNPGANGLAEELAARFEGITVRNKTIEKSPERSRRKKPAWLKELRAIKSARRVSLSSTKEIFLLYLNET